MVQTHCLGLFVRWQEFDFGLRNQAFYLTADGGLRVVDSGTSPLDVDNVLMVAWVMPTEADHGIIMNKSVPAACCLLPISLCHAASPVRC